MERRKPKGPVVGFGSSWFPRADRANRESCFAPFLMEIEEAMQRDPKIRGRIERLIVEIRKAVLDTIFR
jgi:hypothetical protein